MGLPLLEHVGCAVTELPRTAMPADTFHSGGRGLGGQCYWNGESVVQWDPRFSTAFVFASTCWLHAKSRVAQTDSAKTEAH